MGWEWEEKERGTVEELRWKRREGRRKGRSSKVDA